MFMAFGMPHRPLKTSENLSHSYCLMLKIFLKVQWVMKVSFFENSRECVLHAFSFALTNKITCFHCKMLIFVTRFGFVMEPKLNIACER